MSSTLLPSAGSSNNDDGFGSDSLLGFIEMKHAWHLFLCLKGKDVVLLPWAEGHLGLSQTVRIPLLQALNTVVQLDAITPQTECMSFPGRV